MVNASLIILLSLVWLYLGYRFYGKFIEKKIKPNDKIKTPAVANNDGVDYSPSGKNFLIGHHFASIAGAGPIIGPILAIKYFGWLPTLLWICIGTVFIGAMHDYVSLMASVRNKAKSVSNITKEYLGEKTGYLFGIMILITLILIITVFGVSTAESIINKPDLIIPLITITIVAVILGYGVEKLKWNQLTSTIIAMIIIFASLFISNIYQIELADTILTRNIIITIIMLYAGLASIVPVWILLRPRDYLSAIQMSLILILGLISILITRPLVNAPMYISSSEFPLWPILFITVACGAVSGFHGLVASGTTSKQLSKESHAKPIGYGSMLMESILAILVIVVSIAGLSWETGNNSFQSALEKGWIVLFSEGFGNIVGSFIPLLTISLAGLLGAFMVNQFILTSVDTSTRLGRFIISENLFVKITKPSVFCHWFCETRKNPSINRYINVADFLRGLKNKFITTLLVLIPAWFLAVTNSYQTIWRLFGSSNQLIAAITLISVSSYFIKKKIKVKFIVIPAIFMLITTLSSLVYLVFRNDGYFAEGNVTLAIVSLVMFLIGSLIAFEGLNNLRKN